MLRRLPLVLVLWAASAFGQTLPTLPGRQEYRSPTPVWLPRGAFLGTYFQNDAMVPQLRLQWQFTVLQERVDALVLVGEAGGGWALKKPSTAGPLRNDEVDALWEHSALLGLAYRGTRSNGLHFGAQLAAGPLWYGGRYHTLPDEDRFAGLLEGRLHAGYRLGPAVSFGVAVGYAEPFSYRSRSPGLRFVGGPMVGLFADWR